MIFSEVILASDLTSAIVALGPYVAGLVAITGSYLAYKRGSKADEAKKESNANTAVVSGFSALVDGLQADVNQLREGLTACQTREGEHLARQRKQDDKIFAQDTRMAQQDRKIEELEGKLAVALGGKT